MKEAELLQLKLQLDSTVAETTELTEACRGTASPLSITSAMPIARLQNCRCATLSVDALTLKLPTALAAPAAWCHLTSAHQRHFSCQWPPVEPAAADRCQLLHSPAQAYAQPP
jgi:hypothetical protein